MILRLCCTLFFSLLFIPFGIGKAILGKQRALIRFICGFSFSLAFFEILMLIFHTAGTSFRVMVLLWCCMCGIIAIIGFVKQKNELRNISAISYKKTECLLLGLVIIVTAAVTLNTVLNTTYVNWDDQTYCANAVSTWESDKVNRIAPYAGTERGAFYDKKYVIAGWPIYSSMLSVLSGIHPAIIFRTILPLFELPAAIGIIYLLLRSLFPCSRQKALLGLLYYIFFALAVSEKMGGNCSEWWLFVNIWTGKALSFNIIVPLVLWLLIQIEKTTSELFLRALWITLFFVGVAACNIAATMFLIIPIELGIWGGFYIYRTRRWHDMGKLALCAIPAVLCTFVTL